MNTLCSSNRSAESLLAVIPTPEEFKDSITRAEDAIRLSIFLVRIDGLIYPTG